MENQVQTLLFPSKIKETLILSAETMTLLIFNWLKVKEEKRKQKIEKNELLLMVLLILFFDPQRDVFPSVASTAITEAATSSDWDGRVNPKQKGYPPNGDSLKK